MYEIKDDDLWVVDAVLYDLIQARKIPRELFSQQDIEDLRSAGMVGLCKAAARFVNTGRAKFTSYAYIVIRGDILRELSRMITYMDKRDFIIDGDEASYLMDLDNPVFVEELWEAIGKPRLTRLVVEHCLLKGWSVRELAEEIGLSKTRVQEIKAEGVGLLKVEALKGE